VTVIERALAIFFARMDYPFGSQRKIKAARANANGV
jgi:hypothetical protein